jgi:hypothetical protein
VKAVGWLSQTRMPCLLRRLVLELLLLQQGVALFWE